jgi:hypothetical protein
MQNSKLHLKEPTSSSQKGAPKIGLCLSQKPKTETKAVKTLFMRMITWQRDSHGLFDYESR